MQLPIRRIGVLTGGGDAPGLNAVIRAVVRASTTAGIECIGIEDSFDGLIHPERTRRLTLPDVVGIHRLGGTILGTTNRGNPFAYPVKTPEGVVDYSARCIENFHRLELQALVVIGGDGTLAIAHEFQRRGIPVVGVPKTIDNDIVETTMTFGFNSAVAFATEAIDRLHTTAVAHHRVMVVEVMGRYAGWIALYSAIAGGADVVLMPEIPFDSQEWPATWSSASDSAPDSSIVVAAEGAHAVGAGRSIVAASQEGRPERLGGIAVQVSTELEQLTGKETRYVVLGHLQRGGSPTAYDRVLATRLGTFAVELLRRGECGMMVALRSPEIVAVPLERVVGRIRVVPLDSEIVRTARTLGMSPRRLSDAGTCAVVRLFDVAGRGAGIDEDDRVVRLDAAVAGQYPHGVERGTATRRGAHALEPRERLHLGCHLRVAHAERRAAALANGAQDERGAGGVGDAQVADHGPDFAPWLGLVGAGGHGPDDRRAAGRLHGHHVRPTDGIDPAERGHLGQRLPDADERDPAGRRADDPVGQLPSELFGQFVADRLLAFDPVRLLEGRQVVGRV